MDYVDNPVALTEWLHKSTCNSVLSTRIFPISRNHVVLQKNLHNMDPGPGLSDNDSKSHGHEIVNLKKKCPRKALQPKTCWCMYLCIKGILIINMIKR